MVQRDLGGRQDRRPQARTQVYLWEGQVYQDHHTDQKRHLGLIRLRIFKGTNPPLKKSLNIPEIYAKMFGRFF